jgi:hypothetical protein
VDHPPRVVRMCVSTAGTRPGDVHTPPDQPGTHTGTSRANGVGGVSGPDPGGGTGAVSPDIGPLLSDYGAASQDWVNALRECVGR